MSRDTLEVVYSRERWVILERKRRRAIKVMEALARSLPEGMILLHGSVARGDVDHGSDIDIALVEPVAPAIVEFALVSSGYRPIRKEIVQATPRNTPKAYIYLDYSDELVVSFPLAPLQPREIEFYKWGGAATLKDLVEGRRVPGVDKRLMLIEPTPEGHRESPVKGNEGRVASLLGISLETVMERVRVLTRRRAHGRTGVYLKESLTGEEPLEQAIDRLSREDPLFRRALREWV